MKNKRIVGILIENYIAGGCDKIAADLIDNLEYEKMYLFTNKEADLKFVQRSDKYSNIEVVTYNVKSLHMLGVTANRYKNRNKFLYLFFKLRNLFLRYPLMIFFTFYFIFLFKKYKINIFFSNNGGYPGGECNRMATMAFSFFKGKNYHIVHNLATKPFFILFTYIEYFVDYLLDKRSTFICVSQQTKEFLQNNRNIKNNPVVIYNGIKNNDISEKKPNKGTIKLLNVGLLGERKDQLFIINVLHLLKSKGYEKIELYLLGEEEDIGYKKKLIDTINKYNLSNIYFEGFCDPKHYYSMCDIFLLSSKVESFALVRVEAMSHQLPVITTDVGDAHLQIENAHSGYIINTEKEMATKIEEYIENRNLIIEHGNHGYEIFKNRFTMKKMIDQYQKLIDGE